MAKINTYIYYIDNISNTLEITYYFFKVTPRNLIRICDRRTITFIDSIINFSIREQRLFS